MPHIDYKTTVWKRIYIDSEYYKKVLKKFKSKKGYSINKVYETLTELTDEILIDTFEDMTVEENDNNSTLELFSNSIQVEPDYENSIKKK